MSKKRKHDQLQDQDDSKITATAPDENSNDSPPTTTTKSKGQLRQEKSERRAKKEKKSKSHKTESDPPPAPQETANVSAPSAPEAPPKTSGEEPRVKKQKKDKKSEKSENGSSEKQGAAARFIVFVGNLPYDTTVDQIKAHFAKILPSSVRHSTDKGTGKSKGFAFLEFDNYDKMKTCLKLYHHSIFDPEGKDTAGADDNAETAGKKRKGRRINVELTAGGGGKSKGRKAKIRTKNGKLEDERHRRREKEQLERGKVSAQRKMPLETGANATAIGDAAEIKDRRGEIHPSRLSRVSH